MSTTPLVAVIILSWNGERFLRSCLEAVLAQNYPALEVLVVDNGSTDQSAAIVQTFAPRVRLIQTSENLGFAGGNNVGLRNTQAEIVILLNQDTVVQPGWLAAMVETLADSTIGIVGGKALYPDEKTIQHAGARVKPGNALTEHIGVGELDAGQYDQLTDMDYVTGAAFAIHRRVLERLGELDADYYPAFYEEVDYCYRTRRAGFRVVYQPRAVFLHHETASLPARSYAQASALHRNRLRFILRQWGWAELEAFVASDRSTNTTVGGEDEVAARARAYFEAMLALPTIVAQRQADVTLGPPLLDSQTRWVFDNLQALRQQALTRLPEIITTATPISASPVSGEAAWLERLVRAAEERAVPQEQMAPISSAPVVGPLITWLRALWLAVMVRPYLIPLLQQQWEYNAQLVQVARYVSQRAAIAQRHAAILSADDAAILKMLRDQLNALKPTGIQ